MLTLDKALAFALAAGLVPVTALNIDTITSKYFGNDAPWYRDRIPLFETDQTVLQDVYYYRWGVFRAHQRDLGSEGYLTTEFINDVGWQKSPWALLIDASNFHLREGRWSRDRRFTSDYGNFLFGPNGIKNQFSESLADGVWQVYLVDGVAEDATSHLSAMQSFYQSWNSTTLGVGGYDSSKGLYWIQPLTDATEYTISSIDATNGKDGFTGGYSFRPSINSYQYANARAIAQLAQLTGDTAVANQYNAYADTLQRLVQADLWNSTYSHFIDRYEVNNEYVKYWDFIRGRELVGYVPWTHDLPDDNATYAAAWRHVLDSDKLAGTHGLRTNEPSYEYYMRQYRYEGTKPECQWNGPAWPYQTTQVLTALANLLDHYPKSADTGIVNQADYTQILLQYARLHYNPARGGILDLEEDYYPDTGSPIVGLARSPHYFHSGFVDVILSGFVGLRPHADDVLEVNPQADSGSVSYFRAERILYHGHEVAVQWDATGAHYGKAGLHVEVDGKTVASASTLKRLTAKITRASPPTVKRPIAVSVQLAASSEYPAGSVSVAQADADEVHAAIDGRVWFYPESDVANGWDSPAGNGTEIWYQIDFGSATQTGRAEIAFFANATQGYAVPKSYRIERLNGDSWTKVSKAKYDTPLANGITDVSWQSVQTSRLRLVFTPATGEKVRLVEWKVFSS
ncbi:six-hairpin glycosidase [Aspergillus homomorphus CBS 101889]|uniref:Six-hairpin glycosidase n=1 Tax=Aspergillus homomorphus (strain CBS 101889) TaxID=1450537 RepID=A0A395HR14_ASPHC|nr:six-hairpin glycosidase [Aspergillus homomorphus CBS 101889]RAL10257.1 six-hairpin glycosidase [Aspergillus homomorphus CBS 101889]